MDTKESAVRDHEAGEQAKLNQLLIEQKRLLELITTGKPLKECLSALCESVPRLNAGVRACVLLADDLGEKLKRPIAPGMTSSFEEGLENAPINDLAIGTCGTAVFNGEPVTCRDTANDEKWSKGWWREVCVANNILAYHSTPIFDKDKKALGSFMLCFNEPRKPNEWEHRLAEFGTHIASVAVERNKSRNALQKYEAGLKGDLEDAKLLQNISTQLIEEENIEALYEKILNAATDIMRSEYASIQVLHSDRGENDELRLLAYRGFTPEAAEFWEWVQSDSESVCAKAINSSERVVVPDIEKCDFMKDTKDQAIYLQTDIKAVQSTPLISRSGEVLGIISTHWKEPHEPSEHDLRLLDILARQAVDLIEQKQNKKALRENEKWFRQLLEKMPTAAYTCDSEGKITYFNNQAAEVWGREPELNTSVDLFCGSSQLYLPDETPISHNECWMALALKNEKEYNEKEIIIERPDGQRTPALTYATPIHDESEKLIGAINVVVDISDRKRVEQDLRKSENHLSAVFQATPECIKVVAADGTLLQMNPAGLDMVEADSGSDVIGESVYDLIAPEYKEQFKAFNEKICRGENGIFQFDIIGLQDTRRHMESHAVPMQKPDGTVVQLAITRDITERKQTREKLRASEKKYRTLFNSLPVAAFVCDTSGVLQYYNHRAAEIWGREPKVGDPEEKYCGSFRLYLPDGTLLPHSQSPMVEVLRDGEPRHNVEVYIEQPGGSRIPVTVNFSPLKNSKEEITGVITSFEDISELKRTEKELLEMNETLEERVEDRTSSLLAYQKQLRHLATQLSKTEEEERRRLATELHDNLGQLLAICKIKMDAMEKTGNPTGITEASGLVDDALDYTRKLMSELKPPPSLGEKNIEANIEWLAEKMKKHDLEVIINDSDIEAPINLNEDVQITLVQSIRELLFNVVKHASVNEAYITLSYSNHQLEITVEDKGKGFHADNIEENLTEDGGFGLFNIRERVDLMSGSVEIESIPGEGTKVNVIVPLEEEKPADQPDRKEPKGKRSGPTQSDSKIKVLLVDDHEMMRKGLKNVIDGENDLTVIAEAADGEEALKLAHEVQPDVIIMDVNLPGMSGIDATKKIKSELPETVVVGLSVYDDKEVAREMKDVGASAYLTKSDAFETLCATIRSEGMSLNS